MDLDDFGRWACLGVAICGFVVAAWGKARRNDDLTGLGLALGCSGVFALPSPITLPIGVASVLWHWASRP